MSQRDSVLERSKAKTPEGEFVVLLQTLGGFAVLVLVMLGVGGTIYKLIAPDGWLAQVLGGRLGYSGAAVVALAGVTVFAWLTQDWISARRRNRLVDWWVYACAAIGLLYLGQVLVQGGL